MAERTHIPSSPACGQWETLLADALDGLLKPEDEAIFSAHMAVCANCTALFEESRKGREWLEFLSPEPEVPEGLLDKILAQTGPGHTSEYKLAIPSNVMPMLTAAMAFFSIALTLNMTGVRLNDLRISNLRPTAVRSFMERRLTMASTPIIRYYDHLRLVYEVQSRMRELRHNSQGEGGEGQQNNAQPTAPGESKQNQPHKDGGSKVDPPQQSGVPASNDSLEYLETSITIPNRAGDLDRSLATYVPKERVGSANSTHGSHDFALTGSALAVGERSTVWTA